MSMLISLTKDPRGDNGGDGVPVPGGEGHSLAEDGQGVHCGGWGWSGDGDAIAEQLRRMEALKGNIRRWRIEAECSRDWRSTTSIHV